MTFDPSATLEILRHHLHAPDPDLIEIDALLTAYHKEPEFMVVADYLVDQAAQMIKLHDPLAWHLALLLITLTPDHPRAPTPSQLADTMERANANSPGALTLSAHLLRHRHSDLTQAARLLARALITQDNTPDALATAGATLLAACYSVGPSETRRAEQICAILRGADAWDAKHHRDTLLGAHHPSPSPDRTQLVWSAFEKILAQDGAPYLTNLWGEPIPMRDVRYSPLKAFASVMSAAAAVAALRSKHTWSPQLRGAAIDRLWDEAHQALTRCGVHLSATGTQPEVDHDAFLQGHDGELALQIALACGESLLVIGAVEHAHRMAEQTQAAMDRAGSSSFFEQWSLRLRQRVRSAQQKGWSS